MDGRGCGAAEVRARNHSPPSEEEAMATTSRSRTTTRNGSSNGSSGRGRRPSAQPRLGQRGPELQSFGKLRLMPIALAETARSESCRLLNEILSDTAILYALYKKAHWNVAGPTFYQLHLLFDKHAGEQLELVDEIAERVQMLGGISVGDPRHAAELTTIPRPPDGAEEVPVTIDRLLDAHEIIIEKVRDAIDKTEKAEDWGTNDLLMSDVLRRNEMQVWFIAEHVVPVPLVEA
jgi:starvation-inducible DNA-binding protein